MRVLIFSLSYLPLVGGAELAVKDITDRIEPAEIEFDMVTLRFSRAHPKFERVGNINVYRIGGGLGYLSKILFVLQAATFARKRKYDMYWSMMTYMLFPVSLLRLIGTPTPYVLTLQDGDPFTHVFNRLRISLFKPLLTYGFRHAYKVQAISSFLADWARQMGYQRNVEVIPNGVDIAKFENPGVKAKSDQVTLVTASRLVEKNGIADVIEAMKFLPENVKFAILGGGPLEKMLKTRARELKVDNRVEFKGEVSHQELPKQLHEGDIFIRPSLSEGMGTAFVEAMAAGLPVIGTPVGGIPDFLKDGETGLMVESKSPRLIAFQVQKLLSDRVLRDKIVINAKRMVAEKYDWNLIAEEMKSRVLQI
jgi:glycosyltransferase involved in cell wall biosynthesis